MIFFKHDIALCDVIMLLKWPPSWITKKELYLHRGNALFIVKPLISTPCTVRTDVNEM